MIDMVVARREIPVISRRRKEKVYVVATLSAPKQEDGQWECGYQIAFPKRKVDRKVYGADSMHALIIALEGMQAEVIAAEMRGEMELDWQGSKFKMSRRMKSAWT